MNNLLPNTLLSNSLIFSQNKPVVKKSILCWSDCVLANTGFGIVSKHILTALNNTGEYEIDQLAINYTGDFYDKSKCPATLVPARLANPEDPYGNQMFINALQKKDYDFVLIINDTFVVEDVAKHIEEIKSIKKQQGKKVFKLIYYYPIDCKFLPRAKTMVEIADIPVAYTQYTLNETKKILLNKTIEIIYHGTDINNFKPLSKQIRQQYRKKFLNIDNDETFVWINVNRNSTRKDIARSILAFYEFRKEVPNSLMYCHTKIIDKFQGGMGIDLNVVLDELGLSKEKDVIFPLNFNVVDGIPIEALNVLYNCADGFITTHLGEGWGLSQTEAFAAGIPLVCPDNTSVPEITNNGKYAYVYPCKELTYIDNSGYRPIGRMEDIVNQMLLCYKERNTNIQKEKIKQGLLFTQKYSWENVCKEWVNLFKDVENLKEAKIIAGEIL